MLTDHADEDDRIGEAVGPLMEATVRRSPRTVRGTRSAIVALALTVLPLALITAAGATLRLWSFDRVGANPFYDAAVRSMSLSWHNLFFGALEPGGQVSVDKVPADLWLQVLSVRLFGFSGVAVRLPEALASIVAIPLLYDLVRRGFGRTAGLAAAAALAILPAAILTAHSDTMDSLMMLLDVAAAWLIVVGAQRRRVWPVVAAGAVMGLAFDVKLFEALIVGPALVLLVALTVTGSARRRLLAAGAGFVALLIVGLGWIAVASLTPLGQRPWPFGSADGSIWNMVFAYNGVDRLSGSASAAALKLDPPGVLRFFSSGGHDYLATVGTMLLAAIVLGGVALAVAVRGRRYPAGSLAAACAVFFGTWLVTGIALLSHMQRMQPRYLEAVTPAIAAVVGIGIGVLARPVRRRSALIATCGVAAVLAVPAASALTVARQHRSDAGLPSRISPQALDRLAAFLAANGGRSRYEVASSSVERAAPLIVRDGRPVLMLTSEGGRPLLSAARLATQVAGGHVRYALLARGPCATSGGSTCAPAVRWALRHSRDVSAAAGLAPGTLYRLGSTSPSARSG
jgi:4-amino-4-deoxy-L-arabinose transferase-like glycosyltransferase